jgi:hypothetical protein
MKELKAVIRALYFQLYSLTRGSAIRDVFKVFRRKGFRLFPVIKQAGPRQCNKRCLQDPQVERIERISVLPVNKEPGLDQCNNRWPEGPQKERISAFSAC